MTMMPLVGTEPTPAKPKVYITVRATETATAILVSRIDVENDVTVEEIERLPAGLAPAVEWLRRRFPDLPVIGDAFVVIDTDGFGAALADTLKIRHRPHVSLFEKRGRDRQALVDALLVAEQERRIHLDAGSPHADAMRNALLGYRRQVGEDGVVGAELVVALALAAVTRRVSTPGIY